MIQNKEKQHLFYINAFSDKRIDCLTQLLCPNIEVLLFDMAPFQKIHAFF